MAKRRPQSFYQPEHHHVQVTNTITWSQEDDYWIDGGAVESFQPFLGIRQGWMMCADKRKPIHLSD